MSALATIDVLAAEWVQNRGEAALVDAHQVFQGLGPGAVADLTEWLGRAPTAAERTYFATTLRVLARAFTVEAQAEARATGDVTIHLDFALVDDARRNWGTSGSLPAEREALAERARAALRVASAPSFAASDFAAPTAPTAEPVAAE